MISGCSRPLGHVGEEGWQGSCGRGAAPAGAPAAAPGKKRPQVAGALRKPGQQKQEFLHWVQVLAPVLWLVDTPRLYPWPWFEQERGAAKGRTGFSCWLVTGTKRLRHQGGGEGRTVFTGLVLQHRGGGGGGRAAAPGRGGAGQCSRVGSQHQAGAPRGAGRGVQCSPCWFSGTKRAHQGGGKGRRVFRVGSQGPSGRTRGRGGAYSVFVFGSQAPAAGTRGRGGAYRCFRVRFSGTSGRTRGAGRGGQCIAGWFSGTKRARTRGREGA